MIEIKTGSLLDATEKYLIHNTNCVSRSDAAGIARVIFDKFPYADVYKERRRDDKPGTIIICGNGRDKRYVVNLMGQYYPGGMKTYTNDNELARQKYFTQGLNKLAKIKDLESVAFPFHISCGIAGGNWTWYLQEIERFASHIFEKQKAKTVIYQREEDK